jgi:hypothetical protein
VTAAKAYAGAATAILVYVVAQLGLDLPAPVVAALETLVTGAVVWAVRNRPRVAERAQVKAAVMESSRPSTAAVRKASRRRRVDR